MTVIDKISFSFRTADERFAKGLYADWNGFCRRCVTDVMEAFFSPYDGEDSCIEMDRLDLDLDAVTQENFMDEFPTRLREALEKNFIPRIRNATAEMSSARESLEELDSHRAVSPAAATKKRFENFLHYLEYGFCLPEWSDRDFDPGKELKLFEGRDHTERIAGLIVSRPYAAVRLSMCIGDSDLGMDILRAVISSDAIGAYEKRRHITSTLERTPQTVIRFIHERGVSGILDDLAGLIENPQVKGIMEAEAESHAEIGLPEYWYRLYGWLLAYYPFNGVPMFGDKLRFRLHLNRSLLSFIHGRTYPSYLSKAELTAQFLMAVFGAEHHIAVLDIVYHNQPLNPDGSPTGGDSYVWELYYMLMRFSLIKASGGDGGRVPSEIPDIKPRAGSVDKEFDPEILDRFIKHTEGFGRWLEDTDLPFSAKSRLICRLVREKPDETARWLKTDRGKRHLSMLASLLDDRSLFLLAGRISLQLAEIASGLFGQADRLVAHVSWLKGSDRVGFGQTVYLTVLEGIADGSLSASNTAGELIARIAERLFKEVSGVTSVGTSHTGTADRKMPGPESTESRSVPGPTIREFLDAVNDALPGLACTDNIPQRSRRPSYFDKGTAAFETLTALKALLLDKRIPDLGKRLSLLQWFDTWHGDESGLVSALHSEHLLEGTVAILGNAQLGQIALRLIGSAYGHHGTGHCLSLFVCLIAGNMEALANAVSRPATEIWRSLLVALASKGKAMTPTTEETSMEDMVRSLADALGDDNLDVVLECLLHKLGPESYLSVSGSPAASEKYGVSAVDAENDSLLSLLSGIRKYIRKHAEYTPFEHFIEKPAEITKRLQSDASPIPQKQELFRRFISSKPDKGAENIFSDSGEYAAGEHRKWESAALGIVSNISFSGTVPAESPSAETENMPPASPGKGQIWETPDGLLLWLMSPYVSDTAKSQLLRHYARWRPGLLWRLILYSSGTGPDNPSSRAPGTGSAVRTKWTSWLDTDALLETVSGVSLTLGEILRQTIAAASEKYIVTDSVSAEALIMFLIAHPPEKAPYIIEPQTVVRDYISALEPDTRADKESGQDKIAKTVNARTEYPNQKNRSEPKRQRIGATGIPETALYDEGRESIPAIIAQEIERELHIEDTERVMEDAAQPEYIEVPNAGLCLLAVWFTRLFDMLGLLERGADGKMDLRDTTARIRAIFILQRLVTDEKREYREQELALNRILTGCPFHIPLPRRLELTDNEIRTAESMLSGVKSNWDKMNGTSAKGFQRSFIERPGKLDQREDKWVLYVEERSYDILLDSLPWLYRTIRSPWLKKRIDIVWRDK